MTDVIRIEPMTAADAEAVLGIYAEGIATGIATFDTAVPDWRRWHATHRRECRLVARLDGVVVGWTALSELLVAGRLRGVAWESVYVAEAARGRGVGAALLSALIPLTEEHGIWTLIAGVQARERRPASRLHERVGFRRIGVQERVGQRRRRPLARRRPARAPERGRRTATSLRR